MSFTLPLAFLAIAGTVQAMSQTPDETRTLNRANFSYSIPFERAQPNADGSPSTMQYYEYDRVQIYVNNGTTTELYPFDLPVIRPDATPLTTQHFRVWTYDPVVEITLALKDLQGRESIHSTAIQFNFTNPDAPQIICR